MLIDAHVHVFSPEVASHRGRYLDRDMTFRALYSNPSAKLATVEELIASMDLCHIDRAVAVNIGWATHELCQESNSYLLDAASRYPDRLVAFCAVNPLAGDRAVREIARCARLGARGVGELHPDTQGFDLGDSAVMAPVMEAASRHGMAVLTHASDPVGHSYAGKGRVTPEALYRFIASFPQAPIICAHWGGGLPFYALMPEVRQALQHVSFDTAASPFLYEPRVFETVAGIIGPERILFGTDFPLIKQERLLKQVMDAELPAKAKQLVLGDNAARLLGLV